MGERIRKLNDNIYDFDTLKMPFDKEGIPKAVKDDPYKFFQSFWRQYNLATANYVTLQPKKTRSYNFTDNTEAIFGFDKTDWIPGQIVALSFKSGTVIHHNYPVTGNNVPVILRAKSEFTVEDDESYLFKFLAPNGGDTPTILREIGSSTKFEQSFKNEYVAVLKEAFVDVVEAGGGLFDEPGWDVDYFDGCTISWQGDAEISINDNNNNINIYLGGKIYNFVIFEPDGETIRHWFPFCEAPRVISTNASLTGYKKRWDVVTGKYYNINYTDNDIVDDFFYCHLYGFNHIVSPDMLNVANQPFKSDKTSLYPASFLIGNWQDGAAEYHDIDTDGAYFFAACDTEGIRAYDLDGNLLATQDDGGNYRGVFCQDGKIYCACANDGIRVYTFNGTAINLIAVRDDGGFYYQVHGNGDVIFAASGSGTYAYRLVFTDPAYSLNLLDTAALTGGVGAQCMDVYVYGTTVFIAMYLGGIAAYSFISDSFSLIDSRDDGAGRGVHTVDGETIALAADLDGLIIYSFSGSAFGSPVTTTDYGNVYAKVFIKGNYIYTVNSANLLQYEYKAGLTLQGVIGTVGGARHVKIINDIIFQPDGTNGINLFPQDFTFGFDEAATATPQRGTNRGCILKGDTNKSELNPASDPEVSKILSNTKMNFSEMETEAGANPNFSIHYEDVNNDNIDYAEVTTERGLVTIEID